MLRFTFSKRLFILGASAALACVPSYLLAQRGGGHGGGSHAGGGFSGGVRAGGFGLTYAVSDCWLSGDQLHFVFDNGGESSIAVDQLDLRRTVDENAKRGLQFQLKTSPSQPEVVPTADLGFTGGFAPTDSPAYQIPLGRAQ